MFDKSFPSAKTRAYSGEQTPAVAPHQVGALCRARLPAEAGTVTRRGVTRRGLTLLRNTVFDESGLQTAISLLTVAARHVAACAFLGILAGCTPLGLLLQRPSEGPVVVGAPPPPPAGLAPYAGPLPATLGFDLSRFEFPVRLGEVGPIDHSLGALQYPFACDGEKSRMGQPLVDNQDGIGTPVYTTDAKDRPTGALAGYSKDCLLPTRAEYYYVAEDSERLKKMPKDGRLPKDVAYVERNGTDIPFVVRLERGTLNRFIYAIAVLADLDDPLDRPSAGHWNGLLIYYFRGGVGIGHKQGDARPSTAAARRLDQLARGYAVAFSSGTHTRNQYNVWLAANTASMVKAQFEALYGKPRYTVGIGESGGAVQQLLIAQNRPRLLDALIPIYSYPDMITQTIWALDCELLEYYFDVTAADQTRWRVQEERSLIEGLAADSNAKNPIASLDGWARLLSFRRPRLPEGATECSLSWRGLGPLVNNPTYDDEAHRFAPAVRAATRFSHWDDLVGFYGTDAKGHARRTWDNVGVQYGLEALRAGELGPVEFLHLNANVGSWKQPADHVPERYWRLSGDPSLRNVSLWSDQNMNKTPGGPISLSEIEHGDPADIRPAPRYEGDLEAMRAAYWSGHVFMGDIDVPTIDARHYVDPQLNMHHSLASLSTRLRMQRAGRGHDNFVIWVAEPDYDLTPLALEAMEKWLTTGVRPEAAEDACWDASGGLIARGHGVWNGAWNGASETGTCLGRFPPHRSPRNAAGAPLAGDLFKCALMNADVAIGSGTYAPVDMRPFAPMLRAVFPQGVCDYTRGDTARPAALR